MSDGHGSTYLQWIKSRRAARFNLASSGVMPCRLGEIGVTDDELKDLEVNGPGFYGYEPLQ
jgi:hypothetical protein